MSFKDWEIDTGNIIFEWVNKVKVKQGTKKIKKDGIHLNLFCSSVTIIIHSKGIHFEFSI